MLRATFLRVPSRVAVVGQKVAAAPGALAALILVSAGAVAACSLDVVETGFGIKGDEATYFSMALSVAYDGDLAYERKDLERFWAIYGRGPEGIFLKTGKRLNLRLDSHFPFARLEKRPDSQTDRLYHGKAFAYRSPAAPFVRVAGLNGLLLFDYLMFCGVLRGCGTSIWRRSRRRAIATLVGVGFFVASIVPIYLTGARRRFSTSRVGVRRLLPLLPKQVALLSRCTAVGGGSFTAVRFWPPPRCSASPSTRSRSTRC